MKKVLSIDGGGAWGIGVAKFVMNWELDHGKKFCSQFDAFAGTSTGAIIAALFAEEFSGIEIYELYRNNLKDIFDSQPWYNKLNPYAPTYSNEKLKKLLRKYLIGGMEEFKKPIFIPVSRSNGVQEKVFDLGDIGFPKWKAVLASTAAPTYFDPVDGIYMDGGLWANNPADVLQAGLVDSAMHGNYKMLSFATTGSYSERKSVARMTILGWGKYIISDWVTGSGEGSSYRAMKNIGKENFLRIQPKLKSNENFAMDNVAKASNMESVWDREYQNVKERLNTFMKG
jgi:patatin-like phospholipase/acyl hydrolase